MQSQFDVASLATPTSAPLAPLQPGELNAELLRQIMELQRDQLAQILQVQRDHLALAKNMAQDNNARWRTLLSRWQKDMPELTARCKQAYPMLERAYVHMIASMVEEISEKDEDDLDNEFAAQDFLDRYGMRLGQLGHMVHVIGSLAEAANQNETAAGEEKNG
jgi:transketolase